MKKLMEDEIKNSILQNKNLLIRNGPLGKSLIIYEKLINWKSIADCLVMSSNKGIIGIEIKTQYDTLKRLPSQLKDYIRTCQYTYVYCHDSHLKGVIDLLDSTPEFDCVGIIDYEEFDNKPLPGIYRYAKLSKYTTNRGVCSLLWTSELNSIINSRTHSKGRHSRSKAETLFGEMFTTKIQGRIVASLYANDILDNRKKLQRYHFNDWYTHDTTIKGGDDYSNTEKRKWHQRIVTNRRRVPK